MYSVKAYLHIIAIALCTFFLRASLCSEIIKVYALTDIEEHFQSLDNDSLLLWDVDSTLIIPADQVLKPDNDLFMDELEDIYLRSKPRQERKWLTSLIYLHMSFQLVDQNVTTRLAALQEKEIPMFALTALQTGSYGEIQSMEDWRIDQLRKLGIDFSSAFFQQSILEWEETHPRFGSPVFKEGVLCCDHVPKGVVLTTFLQKIDWMPAKVMLIDDNLNYLQSVENAMKALAIPFIGIHYRAVERIEATLDEELAHRQFQILLKDGVWLSDQEANHCATTP